MKVAVRTTLLVAGAAALLLLFASCDALGRPSDLQRSLQWLTEVNQYEGSLVRSYGYRGNDEFVAIVEPTSNVVPEGYLAIGHSDSWGSNYPSLWMVAIDSYGNVRSHFYFDNADGVTVVDAARSGTGRDDPDTLIAVGNLEGAKEGNLALAVLPLEEIIAVGADAPQATLYAYEIDASRELSAESLYYLDELAPVIVGSSSDSSKVSPMIMKLDLSGSTPSVSWQKSLTELDGRFVSCIGEPGGGLIAAGTVEHGGDTNVLVCRFDGATGDPVWSLEVGDPSTDEEGGALLWMSITSEDVALVGSSTDSYPNGWVFDAVTADGTLQRSTFVDIVIRDEDPNPPHEAVEYLPSSGDGYALFVGTEATVMELGRSDEPSRAARRDPLTEDYEFQTEFLSPVTLNGSWRGLIHAGAMLSIMFEESVNNDAMILWPLDGDRTSYPANTLAPPSTLDITPNPPPDTGTPVAANLDATIAGLTGWTLLDEPWLEEYRSEY